MAFNGVLGGGGGRGYGVTMTLFSTRTVAFPVQVAYWILRVVAPTELVNHVSFDQRSRDMAVGS